MIQGIGSCRFDRTYRLTAEMIERFRLGKEKEYV